MLKILYEDNHLLVVEKPPGLPTQPSIHSHDSLEEQAKRWIKNKYNKPGRVFLHAVHRLDKQVSGIVVFAKTSKALSRLNDTFKQKGVSKQYIAWVGGIPPLEAEVLENFITHDDFKANLGSATSKKVKVARLSYRVIQRKRKQSLLEIDLDTGRYHQIRVQLAEIGCPIIGDVKYGSKRRLEHDGIALHHTRMTFPHPVTGEQLTFDSPWCYCIK